MGTWDTNFYSYPSCNPYDTTGLLQKEAMLGYNSRYNANVPSFANNWMASSVYSMPYFNPTFGGGFNGNIFAPPTFTPSAPTNPANQPPVTPTDATSVNQPWTNPDVSANGPELEHFDNPSFQGALDKCTKAYSRTNCIEDEGFSGALIGAGSMYALGNAQTIFHPKNTISAYKKINELKVFDNVMKEGTGAAKLWKENNQLMQEAYNETKKLLRDAQSKGWWSGWFKNAAKDDIGFAETQANLLKDVLNRNVTTAEEAAKQLEDVRTLVADMKSASGCSGKIPTLWRKIRGKEILETAENRMDAATEAGENLKHLEALKGIDQSFGSLLKKTLKRDAKVFIAMEMLMSAGKIITCSKEDINNRKAGLQSQHLALKQAGQSLVKAGINTGAWCLGSAAGTKLGAAIGTMCCPGIGTVIGSVAGFIGGSICSWLANKGMKYLAEKKDVKLFQDKAGQIEAKNLAQSAEGTQQMLINLKEKIDNGEITDNQTIQSWRTVNLAMQQYAQQQALAEQAAAQQAAGQQVPQYV